MGVFINPFTDIGFKRIFGQEFSKPLLLDFLNNLLVGERKIEDITKQIIVFSYEMPYYHRSIYCFHSWKVTRTFQE